VRTFRGEENSFSICDFISANNKPESQKTWLKSGRKNRFAVEKNKPVKYVHTRELYRHAFYLH
jgi:hypothetical protein